MPAACSPERVFYIIVFGLLAVVLVVAGLTVLSQRRRQLRVEEGHGGRSGSGTSEDRRKRKAERAQSRHDRRKRR